MVGNDKGQGDFKTAQPASGDLVDRFLASRLRAALFGAEEQVRLGRLVIEGSLGRGAMGTILSAFDPVLDRHVAIKSLLPDRSEDTEHLLREARVLAKLDHSNVVSVYDVVENNDGLYLVMEKVEGGDLRSWMGDGQPWEDVVELFVQIGQGLAAAHDVGIVHCDVKPENIVVSGGRPRLIDFGLAHQRSDAPSTGGTVAYLAPERVDGGGGSAAADQYAFFASMVEAIEGKRPAADDERWEGMPSWLSQVARRGLNADPGMRYPDMRAAIAALQPMTVRRKVSIAVAALAFVGLAGGTVAGLVGADDDRVCAGAAKQIEDAWSPEIRSAISEAFSASGYADAAKSWNAAEAVLDTYAQSWASLRTQSCEATHKTKEQSPELLDFSMHCLDRRLLEFESVLSLFRDKPNEEVVHGARKTAAGLSELLSCVDPASLENAVALPATDAERQTLSKLQERYEALRNLDRRGEYEEASAQCTELSAQALALGYAPLTAKVLLLKSGLQTTMSDLPAAEKTLREAASAAAQARDDRMVAQVWISVIEVLAKQSRYDEALTLEAVAITSAERVPRDYETQARLQSALGGIYVVKADYARAYKAYEISLAMQRALGADGNEALPSAIANFGLAKWYAGDMAGALADLQEALEMTLETLGPDHSRVAYIRQNIADLQMQLGQPEKSHENYLEVLRIWKASLGPEHPNLAYAYEQLAILAKQRRDFETAEENIALALKLREDNLGPDHALVLQALSVVANIHIEHGTKESLQKASVALERALEIQERLGDAGKRHAVFTLESRARLAELGGDWEAALADRRAVLKLRLETLGPNSRHNGYSYSDIARTLVQLGKLSEAVTNFEAAQGVFDKFPGVREEDVLGMRQGVAEIRVMQGKYAQAISLYEEALALSPNAAQWRIFEVRYGYVQALELAGKHARALDEANALFSEMTAVGESKLSPRVEAWISEHR